MDFFLTFFTKSVNTNIIIFCYENYTHHIGTFKYEFLKSYSKTVS